MFQQLNYPPKAKKVLMNIDDTMCVAAARQIVGTSLGGGNLASSWGTFMVPAAIAKRPIPAGALLTGLLSMIGVRTETGRGDRAGGRSGRGERGGAGRNRNGGGQGGWSTGPSYDEPPF